MEHLSKTDSGIVDVHFRLLRTLILDNVRTKSPFYTPAEPFCYKFSFECSASSFSFQRNTGEILSHQNCKVFSSPIKSPAAWFILSQIFLLQTAFPITPFRMILRLHLELRSTEDTGFSTPFGPLLLGFFFVVKLHSACRISPGLSVFTLFPSPQHQHVQSLPLLGCCCPACHSEHLYAVSFPEG